MNKHARAVEVAFWAGDLGELDRLQAERDERLRRSGRAVLLKIGARYWGGSGTLTRSRSRAFVFEGAAHATRHARRLATGGVTGQVTTEPA